MLKLIDWIIAIAVLCWILFGCKTSEPGVLKYTQRARIVGANAKHFQQRWESRNKPDSITETSDSLFYWRKGKIMKSEYAPTMEWDDSVQVVFWDSLTTKKDSVYIWERGKIIKRIFNPFLLPEEKDTVLIYNSAPLWIKN